MLTAKGTELDTISGLDAGADDYLAKPFSMMELISRANALLRRARRSSVPMRGGGLVCGSIVLDPHARKVEVGGNPVDLTFKEFELLKVLMENPGHALSRAQLFEEVWGSEFIGATRTVDVHMQTLRQKLEQVNPGSSSALETVRGIGYRACVSRTRHERPRFRTPRAQSLAQHPGDGARLHARRRSRDGHRPGDGRVLFRGGAFGRPARRTGAVVRPGTRGISRRCACRGARAAVCRPRAIHAHRSCR